MKNIVFFIAALIIQNLSAQKKHDNIWILGSGSHPNMFGGGGVQLNFSDEPTVPIEFNTVDGSNAVVSMSDPKGELIFIAKGCEVFNKNSSKMSNGGGLSVPGSMYNYYCVPNFGDYHGYRTMLALPQPERDSVYWIFHLREDDDISTIAYDEQPESYLYTRIDMNKDGGLGMVTDKNVLIKNDTFVGTMTAVRHANGRDWWLPMIKYDSDTIFMYLFGPQGLSAPIVREVPHRYNPSESYTYAYPTQNAFSSDGNWYACVDALNGLILSQFDRCTGDFFNYQRLPTPVKRDTFVAGGVAFSPNSRFLYVCSPWTVHQYDLTATDFLASKKLIGYTNETEPNMFMMQLAADGKIYICGQSSVKALGVINTPDEFGSASQCSIWGFPLPAYNTNALPNFPNFNLGPVIGSSCDSLTVAVSEFEKGSPIRIFPNPAEDQIAFVLPEPSVDFEWKIVDVNGKTCKKGYCDGSSNRQQIEIAALLSGFYFVEIVLTSGQCSIGRFSIAR